MLTALVALLSLLFTWVVAFPIGIYSAINKYSVTDFLWTIVGFVGLAIPNFLFALILMYLSYKYLPTVGIGGLFSERYLTEPWSFAKLLDLLAHLWIPVVVIGTARDRRTHSHRPRQPHRRAEEAVCQHGALARDQ